jgi:uncharacterized protein (DUF2062 family)
VTYWRDEFQRVESPILRYGLAIVSVATAVAIGLALQAYQFRDVESPVLALAIGLVTWYAGTGPAVPSPTCLQNLCTPSTFPREISLTLLFLCSRRS